MYNKNSAMVTRPRILHNSNNVLLSSAAYLSLKHFFLSSLTCQNITTTEILPITSVFGLHYYCRQHGFYFNQWRIWPENVPVWV